jgi:plastocyanin
MLEHGHAALRRPVVSFLAGSLAITLAVPAAVASGDVVFITTSLDPPHLEVTPGTTVTWRNGDSERHRIRSREGPEEFDTGDIEPGAEAGVTLRIEGAYPYVDHRDDESPAYFGTIVVTSSEAPAASDAEVLIEPSAAASVSIVDRVFTPALLEVAMGATVEWSNGDDESHTVTAVEGAFDSGILAGGGTYVTTLAEPGTLACFCAIHPDMQGTITVVEAAPVAADDPAASPAAEAD